MLEQGIKIWASILLIVALSMSACKKSSPDYQRLESPDGKIELHFSLDEQGQATYWVDHEKYRVIDTSGLGLIFREIPFGQKGFRLEKVLYNHIDESYELPWGEQKVVENRGNEMRIELVEKSAEQRPLNLLFRAYDDGIAFRYEIPEQIGFDSLILEKEISEFALTGDHTCWWIPGDWDIYEHLYTTSPISKIDAISKRNHPNLAQTYIPYNAVNTPMTMRSENGLHISIHEAALIDYPGMTLRVDTLTWKLSSELVGSDRLGYKAKIQLPFSSPWRSVQISPDAGGLIESKLILNLNEASKIQDMDWFRPMTYVGIWWEMHLGLSSWDMESGKHGATTENAKRYIDFAAENNIGGVLVEGWNTGWDHWIGFDEREGVFDFVTPYPDYDLEDVVLYAREKGVEIIMHHETSAAPRSYEQQLDTAFALMQKLGIHTVKTGYVGKIIPEGEYHHGQWMVNHYRKVIETAAKYEVAVNAHEPIKATGLRRTWPNEISREGLRGQEFNAWASDGGNPPEHLPIVAFTRMLGGPIDFTPGAFEMELVSKPNNEINTTLAHQLALYIVLNGPVQMACDLPENYEGKKAFQFIRNVATNWEKTKVLHGEVGDFVTIARKERDGEQWFLGSISDENSRMIHLDLAFLNEGESYTANIYRDGEMASFKHNKTDIVIETLTVEKKSKLAFYLAEGGGLAIRFTPLK